MSVSKRLPVFQSFIDQLVAIWAAESDTGERMTKARPLLERLVRDETLREHAKAWPSTDVPVSNLLFYVDPDYGFVINGVVRTAGRRGSAHDHAHAWVLYGVLDGVESLERFDRLDDGSVPGKAKIALASVTEGRPGKVDLVEPFAIHAEQGGPGRSVAVIVRSEMLAGRHTQNRFNRETGEITSSNAGPVQIPYEV
jgi:predicted metal-dependent enzyme (double-stranded beta helix superfamily)